MTAGAKKPNAKDLILSRLAAADRWLAVHEFNIRDSYGNVLYSENSLASRMHELSGIVGLVVGRKRKGKNFKEWALTTPPKFWSEQAKAEVEVANTEYALASGFSA